jgi:HSP20 family molecular chaperone IbpA
VFPAKWPSQKPEPPDWKRSLFNGLAQVLVQSTREPGEITLTASSPGLSPKELKLQTQPVALHIVADSK